jgi:gliding motility-associated-like protein
VIGSAEVYWAVWNRWGELIYEANSIDDVWDGSYKGKDQSSDVFAYVLKVKCPGGETFTKKGNVSLIK